MQNTTDWIYTGLNINNGLDSKMQTDMIVLDFAKAFDKVSHSLLLHKLRHYGIKGKNNQWITAFLESRTQAVVLENKYG